VTSISESLPEFADVGGSVNAGSSQGGGDSTEFGDITIITSSSTKEECEEDGDEACATEGEGCEISSPGPAEQTQYLKMQQQQNIHSPASFSDNSSSLDDDDAGTVIKQKNNN
jgi:hypothetical protein